MNEKIKINGLYKRCFEMSDRKNIVTHSHLPFENGYYVTEYDIILKVVKPNIFVLTTKGWENGQSYLKLWYDSMDSFADIPNATVNELGLIEY